MPPKRKKSATILRQQKAVNKQAMEDRRIEEKQARRSGKALTPISLDPRLKSFMSGKTTLPRSTGSHKPTGGKSRGQRGRILPRGTGRA